MIGGHVQWLVARLVLVALLATVGPIHARGQNGDQLTDLRAQVSRLYEQGKYADALTVAERYVDLAHQKQGQDHTEYATAISWLAYVYRAQRRYSEAEPLLKRALAITEMALGADHHPWVGTSLNSLAVLYRAQDRYSEAEPALGPTTPRSAPPSTTSPSSMTARGATARPSRTTSAALPSARRRWVPTTPTSDTP